MRNELKDRKSRRYECGIVNLDSTSGPGTHWVAYKKRVNNVTYFDSYGDLKPPNELIKYLKKCNISYNYRKYQNDYTHNCGHLCLEFLLSK